MKISGYTRKPYAYRRKGKTVRVPKTKVPDYRRKVRGKGKKGKKRFVKYTKRKRQFDIYGQYY